MTQKKVCQHHIYIKLCSAIHVDVLTQIVVVKLDTMNGFSEWTANALSWQEKTGLATLLLVRRTESTVPFNVFNLLLFSLSLLKYVGCFFV